MTLPTTLAGYALFLLGGTLDNGSMANELGWDDVSNPMIVFVVDRALELYGTTEALATDTAKIHSLLEYTLWTQVVSALTTSVDYSADGENFKNSQMLDAAKSRLKSAENRAMRFLPEQEIEQGRITWTDDPYDILISHSR